MPVNVREVKQALLIAATTGSPEQQAAAKEALAKIEGSPTAPAVEITGPVVLGKIKVSAEYAKSLQKEHGSLGDEAIKEAAGKRLCDAASMSDKAEFLRTFPEDEAFYDSAAEQVTALYTSMDVEVLKLRAEKAAEQAASRPIVISKPEPVEPVEEYPTNAVRERLDIMQARAQRDWQALGGRSGGDPSEGFGER